jgi:NADPH-dependent glutamate synthase beta subunit-like oxidoreductase
VTASPLRVAIVGAGPSGFYAAEFLQRQADPVEIDLLDRLPTPFGLVRGGVAPDHPKIKAVTRVYEKCAAHPSFRFLGNVMVGRDLTVEELRRHYHAVIWAVGAETDRQLGIPGEALAGSHAATEFVGWYNGHPDFRDRSFDLTQESAAVIGLGNVAMDVTRILASSPEELAGTDIAPYALEALRASQVLTVYLLGRRGPVQAAFTNPELKELGELAVTDVQVDPAELELDPASAAELADGSHREAEKNLHTLRASPPAHSVGNRDASSSASSSHPRHSKAQAAWSESSSDGTGWSAMRRERSRRGRPVKWNRSLSASHSGRWAIAVWGSPACPSMSAGGSFPTRAAASSTFRAGQPSLGPTRSVGSSGARRA